MNLQSLTKLTTLIAIATWTSQAHADESQSTGPLWSLSMAVGHSQSLSEKMATAGKGDLWSLQLSHRITRTFNVALDAKHQVATILATPTERQYQLAVLGQWAPFTADVQQASPSFNLSDFYFNTGLGIGRRQKNSSVTQVMSEPGNRFSPVVSLGTGWRFLHAGQASLGIDTAISISRFQGQLAYQSSAALQLTVSLF
jgi:hypothetical protein